MPSTQRVTTVAATTNPFTAHPISPGTQQMVKDARSSSVYTTSPDLTEIQDSEDSVAPLFSPTEEGHSPGTGFRRTFRKNLVYTADKTARGAGKAGRVYVDTADHAFSSAGKFGKTFADKAARHGLPALGFVPRNKRYGNESPLTPIAGTPPPVSSRSTPNSGFAAEYPDDLFGQGTYSYEIESRVATEEEERTIYYHIKNGKVSPVAEDDGSIRPLSAVSSVSALSEYHERAPPPVPLKTNGTTVKPVSQPSRSGATVSKRYSVKGTAPWRRASARGRTVSADAAEILDQGQPVDRSVNNRVPHTPDQSERLVSRFSWTTKASDSPTVSTPPRARRNVPSHGNNLVSRFSWTTVGTGDGPLPTSPPAGSLMDDWPEGSPRPYEDIPRSRFSWTTMATSEAQRSPPQTPEPAQPSRSPSPPPSKPTVESVMSRRRPIPGPNSSQAGLIKRKPVGSDAHLEKAPNGATKDLPLSPPVKESVDNITSLEAQLGDLGNRRVNLTKMIKSLTELQPNNPVLQDLAKRKEVKKKVEALEKELDEVRNSEHDLGLRLHRAWRKKSDEEGGSALWVRRVTG